ncbi:MAG TPA: pyridoxal-phosphate dependent enzyme [Kofleriaceae bacterium]|jgi:threonine dehydratase|nr:pyridoxal-phosphate dependent enzyme [Kofleriaceae bacterium]
MSTLPVPPVPPVPSVPSVPATAPSLDDIRAAHARIGRDVLRTPLVRLGVDGPAEIYLKLEVLQPIGSFKLRGAANAMAQAHPDQLARGVYTASAGNMAQGVAWCARARGIPCGVIVPDTAPEAKLSAIARLGGEVHKVPFAEWWDVLVHRHHPRFAGRVFVHPVSDTAVMAGNGTIGLEIAEALGGAPDAVIVPYGGGGLIAGIASALRALHPQTKIYAAEPETAAALTASLAAGEAREVAYTPSFVDGCGSKALLAEMWPVVRGLVDGAFAMPLAAVADAIRVLVERNRVVAEGAGALPVAAALAGRAGTGRIVCVVSGGNLDRAKLARILQGELP